MIEKNPAIGQLMVPVADVQQARANVRTQDTFLTRCTNKHLKELKNGLQTWRLRQRGSYQHSPAC